MILYDPTFHRNALRREISFGDQLRDKSLFVESNCYEIIRQSKIRISENLKDAEIKERIINRSKVYTMANLHDELVLRKIGSNIKRLTLSKPSNRHSIIKCLSKLVSEGLPYRVYKIDIKNFYESISPDLFLLPITSTEALPQSTSEMLNSFFKETELKGIIGLPRGLSLSAILSEYIMSDFDKKMSRQENVFYYTRFVDDIVIITQSAEDSKDFLEGIRENLPPGLKLNNKKTKAFDFSEKDNKNPSSSEGKFDFLGYTFNICKSHRGKSKSFSRKVCLDISDNKVRKIKTRLCLAFSTYLLDRNFKDLQDRVRMLTCNFVFYDVASRQRRKSGIYYSYSLIDPGASTALASLDKFFRSMLLSSKGRLCSRIQKTLPHDQRRLLIKHSFRDGFEKKTVFHFTNARISRLKRCWANA